MDAWEGEDYIDLCRRGKGDARIGVGASKGNGRK